ncbi:MAG TPA: FlgD immunoglobulin-like domain containing protein, partial [Patescibacteria group bacterium]|nr:FlgD immunoglobulin-like domain containing protein [Patescibacteria group bacterium]
VELPQVRLALFQNYPNPFNPATNIAFDLHERAVVWLNIHDVAGRLVQCIIRGEELEAGRTIRTWDGTNRLGEPVSSGVYFCTLKAGKILQSRTITVIR